MERLKSILNKLMLLIMLSALIISNGSFSNIKKARAAINYQYIIQILKPYTIQGKLKDVIEEKMRYGDTVNETHNKEYTQIYISDTSDVSGIYKAIVDKIDNSTLVRSGYHMKLFVGNNIDNLTMENEVTLSSAKLMIANSPNSYKTLKIGWECEHYTDSSKFMLVSGATCQQADQYKCSICGMIKSEGSKKAHNYSVKIKSATCINEDVYRCATCDDTKSVGNYAEHKWEKKRDVTCTEDGILYCKVCGIEKVSDGAKGHDYSFENVVEPTDSSKGYTRHACECGEYYDDTLTYKIEYYANGGDGEIKKQIVSFNVNENLELNDFTRLGYNFTGWNTKADGSGRNYKNGHQVRNISDTTIKLYAQWSKGKYRVTCVDCYEDGNMIESENNNQSIEAETGDVVSGEEFGSDSSFGAYYPGMTYLYSSAPVEVTGNTTVKRYFKDYRKNGLTDSVISVDTLVKVSDKSEKIVIPDEIKKIGDEAFTGNQDIVSVEIKNGTVTQIGDSAFENCSGLKKMVIPYSVKKIGKNAFKGCTSLEMIEVKNPECEIDDSYDTIPVTTEISGFSNSSLHAYSNKNHRNFNSIKVIYDDFFYGETQMEEFFIPADVAVIGNNAFKNCENLKKIQLGKIVSIGEGAFEKCVSLEYEKDFSKNQTKALPIPSSVKKIGKNAFAGAEKIAQIKFEGKDTVIEDKTAIGSDVLIGCYAGSAQCDFARKNKLKMVLLIGFEEDSNAEITGDYKNSSELKAVIIGNKINEIGKFIFAGCDNLEYVKIQADENIKKEMTIGDSAFFNCVSLSKFECDDNIKLVMIDDNAFMGCKNLRELFINNPNCKISDKAETIDDNTIIKSWSGSLAAEYCKKYNKNFEQAGTSYIVHFNKNGGSGGTDKLYAYPEIEMPSVSIPKKDGYYFLGYYIGDDQCYNASGKFVLGEKFKIDCDMVEDKALQAVWSVGIYNVEFNANGAYGEMDAIKNVEYDREFLAPDSKFVREGYHFAGWSLSKSGNDGIYRAGDKLKNLTSNDGKTVILYAQWEENTYNIEYNLNGGTGKMPENVSVLYKSDHVIADNKGTKEYYVFNGWNTRYDGRGKSYNAGQHVKQLSSVQDEIIILYAQWKPVSYSIHLNLNGGELSGNTNIKYDCETNDFTIAEPKKHGYKFTGWSEGNDGKINKSITIKKGSHGDINLNANYKLAEYNVKFETNGGKFSDISRVIKSYKYGENINLPTDITKQNYSFKGWSVNKNSDRSDVARITGTDTGDKIFYAVWGPASYNIVYVMNGGSIANGEKASAYLYGTGIRLPENVTRSGYSFAGWYLDEKCTGKMITKVSETDAGDKKFFAKWIPDGKNNQDTSEPSQTAVPDVSTAPSESQASSDSSTPAQSEEPAQSTKLPFEITTPRPHKPQGAGKENNNSKNSSQKKKTFKYCSYNKKKKTVTLKSVFDKKIKKAAVPDNVKYKGVTYKITFIASDAFKNCKKLKEITIGKNVNSIGKGCFKNCSKLKKINIRSNTLRKIGKDSLKKTDKKLCITCKKKKVKEYKKLFKNKGNKTYKVKKG